MSTWVSRIPGIKANLGLTNSGLGLCLLGTAVGSIVAIPIAGRLVSLFGSKRITAWSTIGFSLALAAPAAAISGPSLFLSLIIFGALAGTNDVAINAQGVAFERATATPSMSRFHAAFSIGGMLGAGIGTFAAALDIAPHVHMWVASLLLLLLAISTGPFLLEADENGQPRRAKQTSSPFPSSLLVLSAIGFCLFLSEGAIADWAGVYLKQDLAASAGIAGAGYAFFSAGMAAFRLMGDGISSRFGPVRTLRAAALLAAAGMTLALAARSPLMALLGFALTGAGFSVIVPLVFAAGGRVQSVAPGHGIAAVSGFGYIGFLIGPPLIGFAAQQTSLQTALFLIVGLSLLAAALANAVRSEH